MKNSTKIPTMEARHLLVGEIFALGGEALTIENMEIVDTRNLELGDSYNYKGEWFTVVNLCDHNGLIVFAADPDLDNPDRCCLGNICTCLRLPRHMLDPFVRIKTLCEHEIQLDPTYIVRVVEQPAR